MHLSRLTTAEMLPISETYLDSNHPAHQALASVTVVAGLLPRLKEAHDVLLASQSQDELRLGTLQKEVGCLSAEHDDLVFGLEGLFRSLALLSEDTELRGRWERLSDLLLPRGRNSAHVSYDTKASNAGTIGTIASAKGKLEKPHQYQGNSGQLRNTMKSGSRALP